MRIGFIGGGAMGEAIMRCLLARKLAAPQDMVVSDVSPARREFLKSEHGVTTLTDNVAAARDADVVVLAVKPQNLPQVTGELRGLNPGQLVLSIMAGITLSSLCSGLGHSSVVRSMPNMPVQIGEGMTVWTSTPETKEAQKEMARTVLGSLGKELYVSEEKYIDMATALSAGGPAFLFLFAEALIDAGVHVGMPRPMSQELAIQTILGSALTIERTGKHPAELKNTVTSPGGTTTEGLFQLEKGGFRALVFEAVAAAHKKAQSF